MAEGAAPGKDQFEQNMERERAVQGGGHVGNEDEGQELSTGQC